MPSVVQERLRGLVLSQPLSPSKFRPGVCVNAFVGFFRLHTLLSDVGCREADIGKSGAA